MPRETPPYKLRVRELRDFVERMIDGDEPEKLFAPTWRTREPASGIARHDPKAKPIAFHKPMRRAYRLTTPEGRTSFHFSYRSVTRVRTDALVDGVHTKPGAAREHCRYIERESAVASLLIDPNPPAAGLTVGADVHVQANFYQETDDDLSPYAAHYLAELPRSEPSGLYVAGLRAAEHDPAGDGMRALPRFDVADGGWRAGLLLRHAAPDHLADVGEMGDGGLRGEADRPPPVESGAAARNRGRGARGIAERRFAYIERPSATETMVDGTRAIFSNISDDPAERLRFWQCVEESEGEPGPDRMTIDVARAPEFWAAVAAHEQCPAELRHALAAEDDKARVKFVISSSKEVRVFLRTIEGWTPKRRKGQGEAQNDYRENDGSLAQFHDGRGGRTQYRIVGELPSELTPSGRARLVRRLVRELERLGLPYNLAIHAPDHGNDEHQWHFHLDFYDRPARLLTAADLDDPRVRGCTPVGKFVGEWDFKAEFYKGNRRDRTCRPFRQNKVRRVTQQGWIEYLRGRFAFAANQELRLEEQRRRYDPRTYDEMGIKAEPGEHLGTRVSAAETKGHVSAVGVVNEQKQWQAIGRELRDRRAASFREMNQALAARQIRLREVCPDEGRAAAIEAGIAMIETNWRLSINADFQRANAQQLAARASSRAVRLERVNQRWLDAHARGETALTDREYAERVHVRDAASLFLSRLEPFQQATVDAVMQCDSAYNDAMVRRRAAENMVDAMLSDEGSLAIREAPPAKLSTVVQTQSPDISITPPVPTVMSDDSVGARLRRLDRERPLILLGREGYRLADETRASRDPDFQAELARRHLLQEREIDGMISKVDKDRRFLLRDGKGWHFRVPDAEIARRFEVLREHPRLKRAIEEVVTPPRATSPADVQMEHPLDNAVTSHEIAAPARGAALIAPAPVKQSEPLAVSPVSTEVLPTVRATSRAQDANAAPPVMTVQRVIDSKTRLRVGSDGRIDDELLARQGVKIAEGDRKNKRLLGLALAQEDYARRAVTNFVKRAPSFVTERDGRYLLSPKTKSDIAMLARDHDSPALQIVLQMAWEQHRAGEVTQEEQVTTPSPRYTTAERDDAIATAKADQEERRQRAVTSVAGVEKTHSSASETPAAPPSPPAAVPPRRPPRDWDRDGQGR
jgi:hypothetical protein